MRLEITRRTDLAIRALGELADTGTRTKAAELAAAIGTSTGFLSQALTPLVGAGWVVSDRGPTGGYSLPAGRPELSVLEVIEAVEGPSASTACVLQSRECGAAEPCTLHRPWSRARDQLMADLAATPVIAPNARDRAKPSEARPSEAQPMSEDHDHA